MRNLDEDYDYEDYDYSSYDDDLDYDREYFYAMTDGMYGDYEDFIENGGNTDSLKDFLGY